MSSGSVPQASAPRRAPAPARWAMRALVALYRRTGGRMMGRVGSTPVLLLTTTGRRSGQPHTIPLGYFELDGARFVVASNGGSARNPAWYGNLVAHPEVEVEVGRDAYHAIAVPVSGEQRARMWDHVVRVAPMYGRYTRSPREIPVVLLRRGE